MRWLGGVWLVLLVAPGCGLGTGRSRTGRRADLSGGLESYSSDLGRFAPDLQRASNGAPSAVLKELEATASEVQPADAIVRELKEAATEATLPPVLGMPQGAAEAHLPPVRGMPQMDPEASLQLAQGMPQVAIEEPHGPPGPPLPQAVQPAQLQQMPTMDIDLPMVSTESKELQQLPRTGADLPMVSTESKDFDPAWLQQMPSTPTDLPLASQADKEARGLQAFELPREFQPAQLQQMQSVPTDLPMASTDSKETRGLQAFELPRDFQPAQLQQMQPVPTDLPMASTDDKETHGLQGPALPQEFQPVQLQQVPSMSTDLSMAATESKEAHVLQQTSLQQDFQPQLRQLPSTAADLPMASSEAKASQASLDAASAVPEWAVVSSPMPPAPFLGGVARGAAREAKEEAFDFSSFEQTARATKRLAGSPLGVAPDRPGAWSPELGPVGHESAFDAGILSKELSQIQRVVGTSIAELPRLAETRPARAHAQTELEAEISAASRSAGALAREAATLSQEFNKINLLLRGTAAQDAEAGRQERRPVELMMLAPSQLHSANVTANESLGREVLLSRRGLSLSRNTTDSSQMEEKGFKKFFTLGNKISLGWAVVYWIALILIFIGICGMCCCWRLRRT